MPSYSFRIGSHSIVGVLLFLLLAAALLFFIPVIVVIVLVFGAVAFIGLMVSSVFRKKAKNSRVNGRTVIDAEYKVK